MQIGPWLSSDLPAAGVHPGIDFAGIGAADPTVAEGTEPTSPPGRVIDASLDLGNGRASATVQLDRPGAVILKSSFDNRWKVTVDGQEVDPQMFAPSLVGRLLPAGRHEITFQYAPFPRYDLLLLIGLATFVALLVLPARMARRRTRSIVASEDPAREPASLG
jgi:hypothetical protein